MHVYVLEHTRRWPVQAPVVKMSGRNCHTDKNTKMIYSNTWMMRIWRNTYNVELNRDVFVLRHSRRCFSHIWDSTSMCRLTEEVDGPMIGLFRRVFIVPIMAAAWEHSFSANSEKPDPSIEQWDSSNDWIVIEEIHVNAALAWSRIPTSSPLLRNWHHACLPCDRKVDYSRYAVREPLAGVPLMVRRLKGVLERPDPCMIGSVR